MTVVPKAVALVEWLDAFDSSLTLIRQYVEGTPVGSVTVRDAAEIEDGVERVVAALRKRWESFAATGGSIVGTHDTRLHAPYCNPSCPGYPQTENEQVEP